MRRFATFAPAVTVLRVAGAALRLYRGGTEPTEEIAMKGSEKPKKLQKKVAQKTLKEKRNAKKAKKDGGFLGTS